MSMSWESTEQPVMDIIIIIIIIIINSCCMVFLCDLNERPKWWAWQVSAECLNTVAYPSAKFRFLSATIVVDQKGMPRNSEPFLYRVDQS